MPNLNYTEPIKPLPETRDKGNVLGATMAKPLNFFKKDCRACGVD